MWSVHVAVCAVVLSLGAGAGAQTKSKVAMQAGPPLEPALVKAMQQYDQAQISSDMAALQRLVADDYVIVHTSGLGDKSELVENLAGPGVHNDPFTVVEPFTRNYGSTVVTGGWVDLHGTDHGKAWEQKTRFADVWAKRGGRWVVVMTTLTPSEKP